MKQTVNNIKLAIIELDGLLLPLNHLRFNFYKNLCKQKNTPITPMTYLYALGNMYTMYDELPLARLVDSSNLNYRVEKDLFRYLSLKGVEAKDGALELLEYFRQKNIRVAVFSTHKTSRAVEYLELAGLQNKCDYVIGSDTKISPLPKGDIIDFLCQRYRVNNFETLVVTSLPKMVEASAQRETNIIFVKDICELKAKHALKCYDNVHTLFEVLNDLLFNYYDDYKIFQDVLGMNDNLTRVELKQVKKNLTKAYQDDQQLVNIVNKAYESKIEELDKIQPYFSFKDEEEEIDEEKESVVEEKAIQLSQEVTQSIEDLVNKIEHKEKKEVLEEENIQEKKEKFSKKCLHTLGYIIYICILSFMVLLAGIIFYVFFINQIEYGVLGFLKDIYLVYVNFANLVFSILINMIHTIFKTPTYASLFHQSFISHTVIFLIPVYIINTIVIGFIYYMYIKKESPKTFEKQDKVLQ